MWKYVEELAASYSIRAWCQKSNIGQRRDTTHATEAPQTTSLPSSRKFWCSLIASNPSSHVQLFCLAFFCSALTQTVLMRMIGITEYKGHSNSSDLSKLKRSTAKWHIKTTLLHPTYSLQAAELINRDMTNDIITEHDVESHYTSLAFYGYTHFR